MLPLYASFSSDGENNGGERKNKVLEKGKGSHPFPVYRNNGHGLWDGFQYSSPYCSPATLVIVAFDGHSIPTQCAPHGLS